MATLTRGALALDHLARGEYEAALLDARRARCRAIRSASTCGWHRSSSRRRRASATSRWPISTVRGLSRRAEAAANNWSLGVLARTVALADESAEAEHAYRRSIALLTPTPARADLARSHLVYGEWLRRQRRRSEARTHLRIAHSMFVDMGAGPFAERARIELAATGERVRERTPDGGCGAHAAGGPGGPAGGRRHDQRRDRLPPVHQREDGRLPPRQGVPEARHRLPPSTQDRPLRRVSSAVDFDVSAHRRVTLQLGSVRMVRSISERSPRSSSSRSWVATPTSTRATPSSSMPDGCWSRAIQPTSERGDRQQRQQHGEAADRDAAHHELVDAVADGVGEHADEQAGGEQRRRRPHRPAPRCADRGHDE